MHYPNEASNIVTTANEIHVPTGVPVRIHGTSRDVIHSFWAPNMQGKRDLMPGYENDYDPGGSARASGAASAPSSAARSTPIWAFYVIADRLDKFAHWMTCTGCSDAPAPTTPQTTMASRCSSRTPASCATPFAAPPAREVGPDLTHLASRDTIAAGALPNTIGNLAGWITNPQSIKPGVRMPPNPMPGSDLQDLLAYLETLR